MAEIVYDLIQLEQFRILHGANGEEYVATGRGGTYKIKSKDLINAVAAQQGFIKADALIPIKLDIDSKIPKANIIDNLNTPSSSFVLSAKQGKILNGLIANFSGQIGSGIIGEAFPATVPISEGFGIYTVSTAGTFVNFKDVNDDPLIVSQADLDSGLVQLWGNDNVWDKHITLVDVFTPIFSDNLSDI